MGDDRRIALLMVILGAVAVFVAGTAIGILYDTAFERTRVGLIEMARSQARLVEAMVRGDRIHFPARPDKAVPELMMLLRDAHERYTVSADSSEFIVAYRESDTGIKFLLEHHGDALLQMQSFRFDQPEIQAARQALDGKSGTMITRDHHGDDVLTAYEPVMVFGLAILTSIDLAEIRAPFLRAGAIVAALTVVAVLAGTALFGAVTSPILRRLRTSERRYRELFDNMTNGVAIYEAVDDGADFVFKEINQASEHIEGIDRDAVIGRRLTEIFPNVHEFGIVDALQRVWRSGEPEYLPLAFYQDDRIHGWRENHLYRLPSGEVVAIYEDVTQLKQAEQDLQQFQKMEALGQLTGGVAHDFNNILAVIQGNLEFLGEQMEQGDARLRLVRRALDAGQRGSDLIQRLLTFSRRQHLRPEQVDVGLVVSGMVEILRRTLDASVSVQTAVAGDLWPVLVDRNQLENAILNLALNAHAAMPGGGVFRIEMTNARLGPRNRLVEEGVAPGAYVMISVIDNGEGMTPEVAARAFEPFFTTKKVGEGSGLGLSMVYGFVKQSGGTAVLESDSGQGTTVRIYLPATTPVPTSAKSEADEDTPSMPLPGGTETVLVVEDDDAVRALAVRNLERLGYKVFQAASGEEALILLDSAPPIQLLFTDVVMPGINGMDLAERVRSRVEGIAVLYVSGYPTERFGGTNGDGHALRLLRKPYSRGDLATTVRATLDSA